MDIVILGASGGTGRELVRQGLARGHRILALVRDPAAAGFAAVADLGVAKADVRDPTSIAAAVGRDSIVLSGLGVTDPDKRGILESGARAVLSAGPKRVIWLGAFGTGASANAAGWLTRNLLKLMGDRLRDKIAADTAVLNAGGTVLHAGPLSNGPLSPHRRLVRLDEAPHGFPKGISRATVAALMLDEAEAPRFVGRIAVPLGRPIERT